MNVAVLLVFVAFLGVSWGEKDTHVKKKKAVGTGPLSKVSTAYDAMTSIKLWRSLRRKQKQLEIARLQLQHLYDQRQEILNRLNGLPPSYNVPVKVLPVAIIPEVDQLIAYRPNLQFLDNISPIKMDKLNSLLGHIPGVSNLLGNNGHLGNQQNIGTPYYSHGSSAQPGIYPTFPQGIPNAADQNQAYGKPQGYGKPSGTGYQQIHQNTYAPGYAPGYAPNQHSTHGQGEGYSQYSIYGQSPAYSQSQPGSYAQGTSYSVPSILSEASPQVQQQNSGFPWKGWQKELGFK